MFLGCFIHNVMILWFEFNFLGIECLRNLIFIEINYLTFHLPEMIMEKRIILKFGTSLFWHIIIKISS